MRLLKLLILLSTPGVLSLFGQAQVPANSLDLKTVLALAESSNLELRAARQQRAVSLAGIKVAGQLPNPTLSFSAARDTPHESVLWDQPLELGGKRSKRIAVANEELKATEIDIGVLGRQIRHRTRDAFYKALLSRAQALQSKAALDLSTRIRDAVRQRFDAGDVAELEVIQAEVEVARSGTDYESATQTQKIADAQLAVLLNQPLDRPPDLKGLVEELPTVETLAALSDRVLHTNTEVLRTTQELAIEERRLSLARSQRIPNLDLQAGVDLNSPGEFDVGPRGQIGITLPL